MSARRGESAAAAVGGDPRVQLLPPSIRESEKVRAIRRYSVLAVIVAAAVVMAGTGAAFVRATGAEAGLSSEQNQTTSIQQQQQKFSDVTKVTSSLQLTKEAIKVSTSTSVAWVPILTEVAKGMPGSTKITGFDMKVPAPWESALGTNGVLRKPGLATITILLTGDSVPDAVSTYNALSANVVGFVDASITASQLSGQYTTTIDLTVDQKARGDLEAYYAGVIGETKSGTTTTGDGK